MRILWTFYHRNGGKGNGFSDSLWINDQEWNPGQSGEEAFAILYGSLPGNYAPEFFALNGKNVEGFPMRQNVFSEKNMEGFPMQSDIFPEKNVEGFPMHQEVFSGEECGIITKGYGVFNRSIGSRRYGTAGNIKLLQRFIEHLTAAAGGAE